MTGGLDGQLSSLFSKSVNIPIFSVTKNLLTKTFGTPAPATKRTIEERAAAAAAKPGPASKVKQFLKLNCFSSGSLLSGGGGTTPTGFLSSLTGIPL